MFGMYKKSDGKTWRRPIVSVPCQRCGEATLTKHSFYALCPQCTQEYLYSLEGMAREEAKRKSAKEEKKSEYNKIYSKIKRTKEKLIDIPRVMQEKSYMRDCLKCEREFVAIGKFNRICNNCTHINNEMF